MKKIFFCFLILLLIVVSLVGCGGNKETNETDSNIEQSESGNTDETNDAAENLGARLSVAYVDMMKSGKYLMKYKVTMEVENQPMQIESTIAVSGDKTAILSNGDNYESTIINTKDKTYIIDHTNKTVLVTSNSTSNTYEDTGAIDTSEFLYLESGTEEGLSYEEYGIENETIRYYFDGKKLVKIKFTFEETSTVMEIIEMSNDVPDSIFEIPKDYKQISM